MAWTPESGCLGKVTYFDKREAKANARSVSVKNARYRDYPAHVYLCPGCRAYHVGHPIGVRSEASE